MASSAALLPLRAAASELTDAIEDALLGAGFVPVDVRARQAGYLVYPLNENVARVFFSGWGYVRLARGERFPGVLHYLRLMEDALLEAGLDARVRPYNPKGRNRSTVGDHVEVIRWGA